MAVPSVGPVAAPMVAGPSAAGAFVSVSPARVLDTRSSLGAAGPVAAHGTVHLQVTGRGGVPSSGVSAVVLNVTVTAPNSAGNVTVYPDGASMPTASNLNFTAGQTIPNLVVAKVSSTGKVALSNNSGGSTQLIADVAGWYVAAPLAFPSVPAPTISGSPSYGSTLHANPGSWGVPGVTFHYQWRSNTVAIGGATAADYTVSSINIGQVISVVVTGTAPGYSPASSASAPTAPIPTPPVIGTAATRTQRMSQSTLNSTQIGWYEAGARLTLVCYQRGQSVQGYFSSSFPTGWDNLWYRIDDGSYAADVDLDTGTLDPVVPPCADQPVADTTNAQVMATTQRMSSDTLNSAQNGVYTAGSRLTLSCYLHGQPVKGYFSGSFPNGYDDLWYQVSDGYWAADVDLATGSNNPVTPACAAPPPPPPVSSDEITRAKSWIDAKVPYNQGASYTNQYGTYREDCSGFVSMALGLPSSYTTVTLPQVMHPISKDELQPGDFMLNSASGDNGHVAIFMGWTDASHTHYSSWEENGVAGYTFIQTVPYPYWSSWSGSSSYTPYRRN